MTHTSQTMLNYSAVMEYEAKLKKAYAPYGICFVTSVTVSEEGYKVTYSPKQLEKQS